MPRNVERAEVQKLVAEGVTLAEVLPAREYEEDHLPGAIHLPLRKLETLALKALDPGDPVVVYCWDST
jgi:rhodanese-related sulfurtransferase